MRRLLLGIYLLGFSFLAAHLVTGVAAHQLSVPPSLPSREAGAASAPAREPGEAARQAEALLSGRLFNLPPTGSSAVAQQANGPGTKEGSLVAPIDAAKRIKLVGVVATEGRAPFAIIEDLTNKKQQLFHLHDEIPGVGSLQAIGRDAVVIQRGAQREILELDIRKHNRPAVQPVAAPAGQVAGGGPGRRTLDQREVAASVADLPKLLSQARATPHYTDGKLDGWRIEAVTPHSLYDKLGIRTGDILTRVNGVEIKDPGMMLTLFQQVKNEKTVTLDLLRDSRWTSLEYEIR